MKYSIILRDVPVEGDKTYSAISELKPDFLLLSLDMGGRNMVGSGRHEEIEKYIHDRIGMKLDGLVNHPTLNKIESFSMFIPSFCINHLLRPSFRTSIISSALRYYVNVETIYIDLGVSPAYEEIQGMCDGIFELIHSMRSDSQNVKIGLVAPFAHWMDRDHQLQKIKPVNEKDEIVPCPFTEQKPLREQLDKIFLEFGSAAHVFVSTIYSLDKQKIYDVVKSSSGLGAMIFWSAYSLDKYDFRKEEKAPELPINGFFLTPKAESHVRKAKSLSSGSIRIIKNGEKVTVLAESEEKDGMIWGSVRNEQGKHIGYVIMSQSAIPMFEEVKETIHE